MDSTTLFDLLSAVHRRRILLLLCRNERVEVPADLHVRGRATDGFPSRAADDQQPRPSAPDSSGPSSLAVELEHVHLPKLVAERVVEYDEATRSVRKGPTFAEVEPALQVLLSNSARFPDDLL